MQGAAIPLLLVLAFISSCCGTLMHPVPSWLFKTNVRAQGPRPSRPPATDAKMEPFLPKAVRQLCPPDWDRLKCFDAYMSMLVNMSHLKKASKSSDEGEKQNTKKGSPMIKLPCDGDKLECFNRYLLIWLQMVDGIEREQTLLNFPKRKSLIGAMHMALETPCLPDESSLVCVERILNDEEATAKFLKSMREQAGAGEDEPQNDTNNDQDAIDQLECEKNPNKSGCKFHDFKNKYNRHRRAMIDICNSFSSTRECFENYLNFYAEVYSSKSQHLGKKHFVGRDTSAALKLLQSSKENNLPATKTQ